MQSLPVFALDLHHICNQQCPYCVAVDRQPHVFEALRITKSRVAIERFFASRPPMNIMLTGGEPLITPNVDRFLANLVEYGHSISLQSNLRAGAELFTGAVPPEKTVWITSTLHSVAYERRHEYARTVRSLRDQGYPIVTKLVLDDLVLEHLEELYDLLAEAGAGVLLSPLVLPEPAQDGLPVRRYSDADWKRIAPRITLRSTWLFFAGGFHSLGRPCHAGSRAFHGRLVNGSIAGCAHSFPQDLGDIYANALRPAEALVTCALKRCSCDYNYYTGVIEGLDDTGGFALLRGGINKNVTHAQYLGWIGRAGVRPLAQLPCGA